MYSVGLEYKCELKQTSGVRCIGNRYMCQYLNESRLANPNGSNNLSISYYTNISLLLNCTSYKERNLLYYDHYY